MKIKITEKQKEFEGVVIEGKVTPFGTSSHIPFRKEHTGKIVNVIVPGEPVYIWLISKIEKDKLLKTAKKIISKENGKLEHYRKLLIDDLEDGDRFSISSLIKVIRLLEEYKLEKLLIKKIKKIYNIN